MSTLLAQASLRACRYWPFASHAILSMVPVPRPGLGTLAVDQHGRLRSNSACPIPDASNSRAAAGRTWPLSSPKSCRIARSPR